MLKVYRDNVSGDIKHEGSGEAVLASGVPSEVFKSLFKKDGVMGRTLTKYGMSLSHVTLKAPGFLVCKYNHPGLQEYAALQAADNASLSVFMFTARNFLLSGLSDLTDEEKYAFIAFNARFVGKQVEPGKISNGLLAKSIMGLPDTVVMHYVWCSKMTYAYAQDSITLVYSFNWGYKNFSTLASVCNKVGLFLSENLDSALLLLVNSLLDLRYDEIYHSESHLLISEKDMKYIYGTRIPEERRNQLLWEIGHANQHFIRYLCMYNYVRPLIADVMPDLDEVWGWYSILHNAIVSRISEVSGDIKFSREGLSSYIFAPYILRQTGVTVKSRHEEVQASLGSVYRFKSTYHYTIS